MKRIFKHSRRGSAVLDATLVLPMLLTMTFGCVEFGHYFYVKHTLQGAAREGARVAATGISRADVVTAVERSMVAAGFPTSKYTVETFTVTGTDASGNAILVALPTITATSPTSGTAILVRVKSNWGVVGCRPMGLISTSKDVVGNTTMRREG
ncbi:MAG TPA: TadE/TadG family type IV pilus assembly protein [Tepidisphaeraceae bacterium]|jgi:Flp pilus assembly protein TadG